MYRLWLHIDIIDIVPLFFPHYSYRLPLHIGFEFSNPPVSQCARVKTAKAEERKCSFHRNHFLLREHWDINTMSVYELYKWVDFLKVLQKTNNFEYFSIMQNIADANVNLIRPTCLTSQGFFKLFTRLYQEFGSKMHFEEYQKTYVNLLWISGKTAGVLFWLSKNK